MQANGIRPDQVTQVRGFADQRLRKSDDPLDPSNRRISLIVQYLEKKSEKAAASLKPTDAPAASAKNPIATGAPASNSAPKK